MKAGSPSRGGGAPVGERLFRGGGSRVGERLSRGRVPSAPGRGALLLAALLLLLPACGGGSENPPDPELREALDLSEDREVPTVVMEIRDGAEVVEPATVDVRPGWLVEFRSSDGHVRTVSFPADSLSGEAAGFLSRTGQEGSPPLVERDARFVVDFTDAPPGRYPFVVEGSGEPGRGAVVVGGEP